MMSEAMVRGGALPCRSGAGFSFVETMAGLLLLLILMALVTHFVMAVESDRERQLRQAREGVMLLKSALGAYSLDRERPPPKPEEGGLEVLVDAGYLERVPLDPWGNAYRYEMPGWQSGRSFDLYSLGPDGVVSEDDVVDWNLYGEPYRGSIRMAGKRDQIRDRHGVKE